MATALCLVSKPVPPSDHGFKYRLVYVVDGERVVGYDNEAGKGDHKHLGADETEVPFTFVSMGHTDLSRRIKVAGIYCIL